MTCTLLVLFCCKVSKRRNDAYLIVFFLNLLNSQQFLPATTSTAATTTTAAAAAASVSRVPHPSPVEALRGRVPGLPGPLRHQAGRDLRGRGHLRAHRLRELHQQVRLRVAVRGQRGGGDGGHERRLRAHVGDRPAGDDTPGGRLRLRDRLHLPGAEG